MIARMTVKTKFSHAVLTLALSGVITLILLEIVLRFLPVSDTFLSQSVTREQPVAKFKPNRDVTWSRGFDFAMKNNRHVNNDGFFNDQDYSAQDLKPLIAVIGDSYIEAVMVPYDETLYGRLDQTLPGWRVYSFGASGAPLSQYLVWAKYARETYGADKMVFTIVGNDFDESLPKYLVHQTFHQFITDENGTLKPGLVNEYHPGWSRWPVTYSALARYMFINLELYTSWHKLKSKLARDKLDEKDLYVGNVPASVSDERLEDSYKAVDAFFDNLPAYSGLKPGDIAFIVDAPRFRIYEEDSMPKDGESYFEKMRSYFIKTARTRGYEAVDMTPPFWNAYKREQRKFEFPTDGHWSGYGHKIVHDVLLETRWFSQIK